MITKTICPHITAGVLHISKNGNEGYMWVVKDLNSVRNKSGRVLGQQTMTSAPRIEKHLAPVQRPRHWAGQDRICSPGGERQRARQST